MSAIPNFLLLALGAKGLFPPKEQGQAQWRGQGSLQAPPHTSGVQALNTTSLSGSLEEQEYLQNRPSWRDPRREFHTQSSGASPDESSPKVLNPKKLLEGQVTKAHSTGFMKMPR